MNDNKLIAEFMGVKPTILGAEITYEMYGIIDCIEDGLDEQHFFLEEELMFDTWNWLMPVVDKCTQIGFRDTDTDDNPLYELWDRLFCDNMGQFVGNHIDEVYNSVVEFIKTYNDER